MRKKRTILTAAILACKLGGIFKPPDCILLPPLTPDLKFPVVLTLLPPTTPTPGLLTKPEPPGPILGNGGLLEDKVVVGMIGEVILGYKGGGEDNGGKLAVVGVVVVEVVFADIIVFDKGAVDKGKDEIEFKVFKVGKVAVENDLKSNEFGLILILFNSFVNSSTFTEDSTPTTSLPATTGADIDGGIDADGVEVNGIVVELIKLITAVDSVVSI